METALQQLPALSPGLHSHVQNKVNKIDSMFVQSCQLVRGNNDLERKWRAHGIARMRASPNVSSTIQSKMCSSRLGQSRTRWVVHGAEENKESAVELATEQIPEDNIVDSYIDEKTQEKQAAIDALKAQEKFMVVGEGDATCMKCGYEYKAAVGDKEFPIPRGTGFQDLPDDYYCPLCNAPKSQFRSSAKEVAGFAVNQGYGLGTNSMTGGQKQAIIFGSLVFFFFLFLGGYFLQ